MEIITWLMANWDALITIVLSMHGVAVLIVNLTPTPKDDLWVAKAYRAIEVLAGLVTRKAKS